MPRCNATLMSQNAFSFSPPYGKLNCPVAVSFSNFGLTILQCSVKNALHGVYFLLSHPFHFSIRHTKTKRPNRASLRTRVWVFSLHCRVNCKRYTMLSCWRAIENSHVSYVRIKLSQKQIYIVWEENVLIFSLSSLLPSIKQNAVMILSKWQRSWAKKYFRGW